MAMTLKLREELCVMKMKIYAKFEEELTCRFKIDIKNFTNFDPSCQKAKKCVFLWAPLTKVFEPRKLLRSLV